MAASRSNRLTSTATPGERAIDLSLSVEDWNAAKDLEIDISQACDDYLRDPLRREQERRWREDHADFIAAYNATIEAEGLLLDQWRSF